jgi:hypothetical protein
MVGKYYLISENVVKDIKNPYWHNASSALAFHNGSQFILDKSQLIDLDDAVVEWIGVTPFVREWIRYYSIHFSFTKFLKSRGADKCSLDKST